MEQSVINSTFKFRTENFDFCGPENCSITKSIERLNTFYELEFLNAIEQIFDADKWVVDVGAHIGNHSIYLAKILGANVLAFEPNPITFTIFKRNIEINALQDMISPLNLAVSKEAGSASFSANDANDPGTYSMLRAINEDSFHCRCVRLDDYLDYFQNKPPGLIKIDVEGAEALVLEGALQTLKIYRPIVTTEIIELDRLMEIEAILTLLGYAPVGIYNATPTIIWSLVLPGSKVQKSEYQGLMQILSYGVQSALTANDIQTKGRQLEGPSKQAKPVPEKADDTESAEQEVAAESPETTIAEKEKTSASKLENSEN